MRLVIRDDPEAASLYAAEYIIKRINSFNATRDRPFVLGLPTGSSPLSIYRALIQACHEKKVSFRNVVTFNMDEYVGLPREHPESYYSFMHTNFFSNVDIDPDSIHILDGNAAKLEDECAAYEAKIKAYGGIQLFLGGVGSDGHIAFNEPGSSLASRTRVKSLAYETRLANARFFHGDINSVPRMALTVGVQTIMDAKEVVIIATGAAKALAVQQAVEGGLSHLCTLSCLQMHPCSMIILDEDATLEMRVKTVNYFKGVERTIQLHGLRNKLASSVADPMAPVTVPAESDDGELMPDNMESRIKWAPRMAVRSATIVSGFTSR